MTRFLFLLLLAVAFGLGLSACASPKSTETDPNGDTPSTIPWNRPASWESGGALGGAMGH